MSSKKKARTELPYPAIKRCLQEGSGKIGTKETRVSELANKSALEGVKAFLCGAAKEATGILKLQKKVTVTKDVLASVLLKECGVIMLVDLSSEKRAGEKRGLPSVGVSRIFSACLHKDNRMSEESRAVLVNAAEAFLRGVGERAGMLARAGGRNTIKAADVVAARKLMSKRV
jgi:histone H3/H4